MKGIVFDIKEFSLNDGPGIRTTVFLKGCPLSCKWCHNPEGIMQVPQLLKFDAGSRHVGTEYIASELAEELKKNMDEFIDSGGGVTLSGGEPLMQPGFISELIKELDGVNVLLDTSGYAETKVFSDIASLVQHIYFDLKLADSDSHLYWTGVKNDKIIKNLILMDKMGIPYTIRIPLIPTITDSRENLGQIADIIIKLNNPKEIQLLSYNTLAGSKYKALGMEYQISPNLARQSNKSPLDNFAGFNITVKHLSG